MKKTLAEFKRAIHTGMEIEYVRGEERKYSQEENGYRGDFVPFVIAERLRGPRYVSYVDTTGFYLKRSDDKSAKGSYCEWPKAADLEFDGSKFIITERHSVIGDAYQRRHYQIIIK